jgi:hypothetical protein
LGLKICTVSATKQASGPQNHLRIHRLIDGNHWFNVEKLASCFAA